ncbi:hypothetical protein M413DRAFT_439895 [Hebeloma cylindrosporum]|uniref:Uncharacterized protein n=1 Tax=Hebeloma cylindrosporum TaxID=76867 RepID=A0A0C3CVL9_HEBCY|nr:hypothetical protein M413DRAFT_439895 [Hebeloma cylindrosporum h7]
MRSFTPFLSFLISIFFVPLFQLNLFDTQSTSSGRTLSFAHAAELQNPHSNLTTSTSRDLADHSNFSPSLRRHAELGRTLSTRFTDFDLHLGRRASGAHFTYYVTGLGACGTFNKASDFVVALNMEVTMGQRQALQRPHHHYNQWQDRTCSDRRSMRRLWLQQPGFHHWPVQFLRSLAQWGTAG